MNEDQIKRYAKFMSVEMSGMSDPGLIQKYVEHTFTDLGLSPEDQKTLFSELCKQDARLRPSGVIWKLRVIQDWFIPGLNRLQYGKTHAEKFRQALNNSYEIVLKVFDGQDMLYNYEIPPVRLDTVHNRLNLGAEIGKVIRDSIEKKHIIELIISKT
jgi:hypothetical protein